MKTTLRPVLMAFLLCLSGTQARATQEPNLLQGLAPAQSSGVANFVSLTDGIVTREGQDWTHPLAARFNSWGAGVVYDLGGPTPVGCVWLQADNNDEYLVQVSVDGQVYRDLWQAPAVAESGLRLRYARVSEIARFLRLKPAGGDGAYSVSEFGAASACTTGPQVFLKRAWFATDEDRFRGALSVAMLLWAGFILINPERVDGKTGSRWRLLALAGGLLASLTAAYFYTPSAEALVRADIAALAGLILVREGFARTQSRVMNGLLWALALLAVASYYHFGALQFSDASKGRNTFVHEFDMRHYFPLAKYFPELRFDGLYLASLAAYEDELGTPAYLQNVRLRDLDTAEMIYAPQAARRLPEVRSRFSAERWAEFRRDMRYFMDSMGANYLSSMQDHGGNATPAWILVAWALFRKLPANEITLSLTGLIDPALLLLMFGAIWKTFGMRTMLCTAVLFGATDFHMFGSNLMGSTLRQDWLVALGLGACALKKRWWLTGGALLAYAGMIRAFPAVSTLFLAVPLIWWLVDRLRSRAPLGFASLGREQGQVLRAGLGTALTVAALFGLSSAVFGLDAAWGGWLRKIEIHATGPSVNNVGLRNVMSYQPRYAARNVLRPDQPEPWIDWQRTQKETYAHRRPLTLLILAAVMGLALYASRRRELHAVALIGLMTVPFFFYPSNYYCHYIFLLPLVLSTDDRRFSWLFAVLCALCVGQYFTLSESWMDLRYTWQSFLLLGAFVAILIPLAWENRRRASAAHE